MGDAITVEEVDTFEVKEVRLRITGIDGLALEEGPAEREDAEHDTGLWRYTVQTPAAGQQTVSIEVTAPDYAGNSVSRVFYHPISTVA